MAQLLKYLSNKELHIRVFMAHSYLNVCQTQSYKGVYGTKPLKCLSSAVLSGYLWCTAHQMFVKHRTIRVLMAHSSSNVCQTQNYKGVHGAQLLKCLSNAELQGYLWRIASQMFVKHRDLRVFMAHSSSNVCQAQSYKGVQGTQLLKCLSNAGL